MGNIFGRRPPSMPTFHFEETAEGTAEETATVAQGVPVAQAVNVIQPVSTACTLTATVDKPAVGHLQSSSITAMLSLKAPAESSKQDRAPLDLALCIDRSGSMHGHKMVLMKKTLELLVSRSGLTSQDRVALVTFDSMVKLDMGLLSMDSSGRAHAQSTIRALRPGSTTNLSGGALKAIDTLATRPNPDGGRTRAVMLFTDGLANNGISEPSALINAVSSALRAAATGGAISLFTFGFGEDHDETVLRDLAASHGSGGYYYVASAEDIPNAFADCLGGLTSVVAQNATLSLEPLGGAMITKVLGSTYSRTADGSIELGDLYAEDEKDILVELTLPALETAHENATGVLRGSLRAFNVAQSGMETVDAVASVARPTTSPVTYPVNVALDLQRNRIAVAEAMESASRLADSGDVAGGRATLKATRAAIKGSGSCEAASSVALVDELLTLEQHYDDEVAYRSVGSKMSKMQAYSHQRQRANHTSSVGMYKAAGSKKRAMKNMWMSSIAGSDSD